ncbi:MAG: DUF2513 domain-containing protein [Proteobacteria bacterium]|nr:DUF2513 domain-containing protein [Pseudomonadota bacterium]
MKRDFDLIRLLLLDLEGEERVSFSEYTEDQINYHKALLLKSGLAEGPDSLYSSRGGKNSDEIPDCVYIKRLTWNGHEFLDQARNNTVWNKAKKLVTDQRIESFQAYKIVLPIIINELICIESKGDVTFSKDQGRATTVKDSQAGVIGDNSEINGGIHFGES